MGLVCDLMVEIGKLEMDPGQCQICIWGITGPRRISDGTDWKRWRQVTEDGAYYRPDQTSTLALARARYS